MDKEELLPIEKEHPKTNTVKDFIEALPFLLCIVTVIGFAIMIFVANA